MDLYASLPGEVAVLGSHQLRHYLCVGHVARIVKTCELNACQELRHDAALDFHGKCLQRRGHVCRVSELW